MEALGKHSAKWGKKPHTSQRQEPNGSERAMNLDRSAGHEHSVAQRQAGCAKTREHAGGGTRTKPIDVTLPGIVREHNLLHPAKALCAHAQTHPTDHASDG